MICYYNGNILRTKTDVKYVGNKPIIVSLDVPVDCTFEQLGDMIYSRTTIDKQRFKLVLNCKYPLEGGNRFQPFPIWDDSSVYRMLNMVNTTGMEEIELYIEVLRVKPQVNQFVGGYTNLLVLKNDNVVEFDYGCGPSSCQKLDIERYGVYGDDKDYEYEEANDESDEDVDDESNGDLDGADGHVSSFQTFNQVLENELRIYVSVHATSCDVSNNPNVKESMSHHLFIITCHHHLNLNMLKTLLMLFQVIGFHGCNILSVIQVGNL